MSANTVENLSQKQERAIVALLNQRGMSLATRLRRLEQSTGSGVCPSCGRVPGTERLPNGEEAPLAIQTAGYDGDPASLPPDTCPVCGACLAITIVYRSPPLPEVEA